MVEPSNWQRAVRLKLSLRPAGVAREAGARRYPAVVWVAHPRVRRKTRQRGRLPAIWAGSGRFTGMNSLERALGPGLVAQPGEALVWTQHRQHVENRRRGGAAGQRRAQRLRHRAELPAGALGKAAHDRFDSRRGPVGDRFQFRQQRRDRVLGLRGQQRLGLGVERERAARPDEARGFEQLDQRLGALLQAGMAAMSCSRRAGVILPASSSPPAMCGSRPSSAAISSASPDWRM